MPCILTYVLLNVFTLKTILQKTLILHPKYFSADIKDTIVTKLHEEVEGTCSGRYGFIVNVISVEAIGKARIQEGTGFAIIPISYKAIVFKPYKGEIVDGTVTQVSKVTLYAV